MKANGVWCGLHYNRDCDCDHHCTECPNIWGHIKENCCTCCRPIAKANS